MPGTIAVNGWGTRYNPAVGYGWTAADSIYGFDRGKSNPLTTDVNVGGDASFAVDLPDGTYTVTATVGDEAHWRHMGEIWAEGQLAAQDLRTETGQFQRVSFPVMVTDGQLDLRFVGGPYSDRAFGIAALQISLPETADAALMLRYSRAIR